MSEYLGFCNNHGWTKHFSGLGCVECDEKSISSNECIWKEHEDEPMQGCWETSCGEDFCLIADGPKENQYNFCPKCGGKIKEEQ